MPQKKHSTFTIFFAKIFYKHLNVVKSNRLLDRFIFLIEFTKLVSHILQHKHHISYLTFFKRKSLHQPSILYTYHIHTIHNTQYTREKKISFYILFSNQNQIFEWEVFLVNAQSVNCKHQILVRVRDIFWKMAVKRLPYWIKRVLRN